MGALQIGIPVTSASGFGLAVCMAEGRGLVERIDPDGSVAQWNSSVAPEIQVDLGDRIDGFKVKGQSLRKLISGNEFLELKSRAIVLQVTKPSTYTVRGRAPFGIAVKKRPNCDKAFFVVSSVLPDGSIERWNAQFPNMQVSAGDVIRAVNGVKGLAVEVQKMLGNEPDEEKEFLVFHYPNTV